MTPPRKKALKVWHRSQARSIGASVIRAACDSYSDHGDVARRQHWQIGERSNYLRCCAAGAVCVVIEIAVGRVEDEPVVARAARKRVESCAAVKARLNHADVRCA